MEFTKTKRGHKFSPAEQKRRVEKAQYCLFVLGLNLKETAEIIGISQNTMTNWVKALGWKEKLNTIGEIDYSLELKCKDSLSGFMAYLQKRHPLKYKNIHSIYNIFINIH